MNKNGGGDFGGNTLGIFKMCCTTNTKERAHYTNE